MMGGKKGVKSGSQKPKLSTTIFNTLTANKSKKNVLQTFLSILIILYLQPLSFSYIPAHLKNYRH